MSVDWSVELLEVTGILWLIVHCYFKLSDVAVVSCTSYAVIMLIVINLFAPALVLCKYSK